MPLSVDHLALEMRAICKSFAGSAALSNVDFDVRKGEVHALMGENGAGKSTLTRILAGVYKQDSGTISVHGEYVAFHSPRDAAAKGIAIIHQELSTVPDMTVAENLALGEEPVLPWRALDRRRMISEARRKLDLVQSDLDPNTRMRHLSVGMQQVVEISKAVSRNARILILDEPTASLSNKESEILFQIVAEMRTRGMGLVLISHRLEEVWDICDRVTVLRDGHVVGTSEREGLTPSEVINQMIGRKIDDLFGVGMRQKGRVVLDVQDLTDGAHVGPVSLKAHAGEVVGLFGLVGSGRTEFARLIFGADRRRQVQGRIRVNDTDLTVHSPVDAIRGGIAMLPEDRKDQGLFMEMSVAGNITISALEKYVRSGVLRFRAMRTGAERYISRLKISASSTDQTVNELSGGNQQKVLLARWLEIHPQVLILDEPTRGVDIGAKNAIYETINDLVNHGVAVILISSELEEIMGMTDRVVIFRKGRAIVELVTHDTTDSIVLMYATGVKVDGACAWVGDGERSVK